MTTPSQLISAITGTSCKLMAVAVFFVAVAEAVNFTLDYADQRRRAK